MLGDLVSRTDCDDFAISDEHSAVFNNAQFAHLRTAAGDAFRNGIAQGQQLRSLSKKSGGTTLRV